MAEIVIIGHGGYAEGVRSNLEMVIGVPESMHFLNFALGMERSELEAALSALVEGLEGREILFCVDLPGATPFQLAAIHTAQNPGCCRTVVGLNPMAYMELAMDTSGTPEDLAKRAMSKQGEALLVEGQADVISLSQRGVENVVAGSGTALTIPQIKLIHRFTPNVTLVYDGDEAGQKAALRGTDLLLSEGMNVKVLFLPDGQDPDDFARSRSSEELQAYIEQNRTDFIVFQTQALLQGVTDPVRRAEAVNQIVRSIAVIRDPIVRASYLRECAHRTDVREDTLIAQMNRFIYQGKEARQREEERAQASQASQQPPFAPASPMQQASKVEKMLIETVIRHGGEVILPDVEDETSGQHFDLNVAQYIAYDLAQDQLAFSDPLYNRILAEAVEQSEKGPFDAGKYFRHHPDIEIQTLAASMSTDAYQLSESLQMKESVERLRDTVVHLVMDFRLDYIEHQLKVLQDRLKKALAIGISTEEMKQMMEEIKNWQTVRNAVARKLGSDIV